MTSNVPISPAGFSDEQKLRALDLRTRIQNGESVSLDELKGFILSAETDLAKTIRPVVVKAYSEKIEKPKPKTDVDFF